MIGKDVTGRVHSIQSLGTLDGPGVRFVVFLQGCHLRCGCCHNPDTWDRSGGTEYTASDIVEKAARYREYFGARGGITLSGGEPLLQAEFAQAVFALCHEKGLSTCLDTSGSVLTPTVERLLRVTDRVLLDIKYTSDASYRRYVGCSMQAPLRFLACLNERNIPVTLRQVIIPTLNDTVDNVLQLKQIATQHPCVDKIELLPFRKICQTKYDSMDIVFPFAALPEPSPQAMAELNKYIN